MEESEAIVELLEDLLGDHGLHYPNRGQISFNCPVCDEGRNKHNLEIIDVFNDDATLNNNGLHYKGLDRFVVRSKISKELDEIGALIKTKNHLNKVGKSERTKCIIEPKLSEQWFLKMEKISKPALNAVIDDDVKLFPKKFKNTYKNWMENVRDWNISRQLWWGHQIPVYYYGDNKSDFVVAESKDLALIEAIKRTKNSNLELDDLVQEEDVLDTWFSSWIWPISVLDGIRNPENSDFKYKVGKSRNCNERESSFKTGTYDGKIIHQMMCVNSNLLEKVCHFILDKYRIASRREWFDAKYKTIKNAIEYAKLIIESEIDFEQDDLIDKTQEFIKMVKKNQNIIPKTTQNEDDYKLIYTKLELKMNLPSNYDKFFMDCCESGDEFMCSYIEVKHQYKIWSKIANHNQLQDMIDYMKTKYKSSMRKINPLVSTSKVTNIFIGFKIKSSLYSFTSPINTNYVIENFLYKTCQRSPGFRVTISELINKFDEFCKITYNLDTTYYIQEQLKDYCDIMFIRLRKGMSNSTTDKRLGGWLGIALNDEVQKQPILNYQPKNRKTIVAIEIPNNTTESMTLPDMEQMVIHKWSSVTDVGSYITKSRSIVSNMIKRKIPITLFDKNCYLSYGD